MQTAPPVAVASAKKSTLNMAADAGNVISTLRTLGGLVLLTIIFGFGAYRYNTKELRTAVIKAEVEHVEQISTGKSARYKVRYVFKVSGANYKGETTSATPIEKGSTIDVEYDPADPKDNAKDVHLKKEGGLIMAISCIGAILVLGNHALVKSHKFLGAATLVDYAGRGLFHR